MECISAGRATDGSGVEWWWKGIFIGSHGGVSAFCPVAMEMGSATGREMVPIARERRQQLDEFPPKTHFHYSTTLKNTVMLSFAQVAKRSAAVSFRRQAVASRSE